MDAFVTPERVSYYEDLSADFSRPGLVTDQQKAALIRTMKRIHGLKAKVLPAIDAQYPAATIEKENREWFPTHCNALREERFDLLNDVLICSTMSIATNSSTFARMDLSMARVPPRTGKKTGWRSSLNPALP
jgi:hypothetical protein